MGSKELVEEQDACVLQANSRGHLGPAGGDLRYIHSLSKRLVNLVSNIGRKASYERVDVYAQ